MALQTYQTLAVAALTAHLAWILWVLCGWLLIRNRPLLRRVHILSLIYSILIETLPLPCPLTLAEQWLQGRSGMHPYQQPFLVHYLNALIYPDLPAMLLTASAGTVCGLLLGLHALRYWLRPAPPGAGRSRMAGASSEARLMGSRPKS
jgi:hypothetical protein